MLSLIMSVNFNQVLFRQGHCGTLWCTQAFDSWKYGDIVTRGISVSIPPFLNDGTFTESETKPTKATVKCYTRVE